MAQVPTRVHVPIPMPRPAPNTPTSPSLPLRPSQTPATLSRTVLHTPDFPDPSFQTTLGAQLSSSPFQPAWGYLSFAGLMGSHPDRASGCWRACPSSSPAAPQCPWPRAPSSLANPRHLEQLQVRPARLCFLAKHTGHRLGPQGPWEHPLVPPGGTGAQA